MLLKYYFYLPGGLTHIDIQKFLYEWFICSLSVRMDVPTSFGPICFLVVLGEVVSMVVGFVDDGGI